MPYACFDDIFDDSERELAVSAVGGFYKEFFQLTGKGIDRKDAIKLAYYHQFFQPDDISTHVEDRNILKHGENWVELWGWNMHDAEMRRVLISIVTKNDDIDPVGHFTEMVDGTVVMFFK